MPGSEPAVGAYEQLVLEEMPRIKESLRPHGDIVLRELMNGLLQKEFALEQIVQLFLYISPCNHVFIYIYILASEACHYTLNKNCSGINVL